MRGDVTKCYEIGPFRLDAEAGLLTHDGSPVELGPRAVAVLTVLVSRRDAFVSKDSIMDIAWPGLVVAENNVAVQISAVRKAIARAPGGDSWIETLPRRGYRFVGPACLLAQSATEAVAGAAARSNLPEPVTSFIGRERELSDIRGLLAGQRLVTLVGTGGIGKSRLALRAASEAIDRYRDGVWLVDLAAVVDPRLVAESVAQVLGVQEQARASLTEELCAHLKPRRLLLVLDNCEHLIAACSTLIDALLRCAGELTIVATSREPLHVAGEQTFSLPALSLPGPEDSVEAILRSEAGRLFVERARLQLPGFEPTERQAPALALVCARLDGIPLALEFAAARVRLLSLEQIAARLDDRFRLLTSETRLAPPRQQTLRATLDWSFDLLNEQERTVLRRLAIFPGGFTLEAASCVASDAQLAAAAVIDVLAQLVARSLVIADTRDAGARYRFYDTTRAYAREKLAEANETASVERRHAQYFRDLYETAPDDWLRLPDADWSAAYLREVGNVRAALDWALSARGDAAIGIALAGASGAVWLQLSLLSEARQRLEAAVARVGPETPVLDQARLWLWLGSLWLTTAPVQAVADLQRAVELYRRLGDTLGLGYSLVRLGGECVFMGRLEQAAPILAEALSLLESAAVPRPLAQYHNAFGLLKVLTGDPVAARSHYEKALSLYRTAGAERMVPVMLGFLADMMWAMGDLDAALAAFHETVARQRRQPHATRSSLGFALTNLAGVLIERGQLDEAMVAAREGLPLLKGAGHVWYLLDYLALRAALIGHHAEAARMVGYADAIYLASQISRQPNEARARARLQALLHERLGCAEVARLLADGATLSEDEACRIALDPQRP
jgi:predicted ATPase/DNA-binding winged helix-turn-helix (wHTH) protein